ncbi:MAG: site-2 protease family protein [Proteobacteria bacterium]|nr:site-2 protease family protein [Pseudomonadota bacterium]
MRFDINTIREIVVVLVPMILSLTVHEFAHAWSAYKLGDNTARSMGRMTLNPLVHIDLFGTLLIPMISVLSGGLSLIGWAKPVPVAPFRFNRTVSMRTGMIITAFAGPASNVILAILVSGVVMILYSDPINALAQNSGWDRIDSLLALGSDRFVEANADKLKLIGITGFSPALMLLGRIFVINIFLAVFNMLPIPPLDGSRVLPLDLQQKMMRYTIIVFLGFIMLINVAGSILWVPVSVIGNLLLSLWALFV